MKKLTALMLALLMIFALCACSDGGKDEDKSDTEALEDGKIDGNGNYIYEGEDGGFIAQTVNPMVEVTPEELEGAIGVALVVPEASSDVKYFIIGGTLAEVQFVYGGVNYSYRAQKTDKPEDISGVWFSSGSGTNIDYDSIPPLTVTVEEGGSMGAATWYDNGYSYSISMGEGANLKALESIYELIYS